MALAQNQIIMRVLSVFSVVVVIAAVVSLMATPTTATRKKAKNIIPALGLQQPKAVMFYAGIASYNLQVFAGYEKNFSLLLDFYQLNCIINVQTSPLHCFYTIVHSSYVPTYYCWSLLPTIKLNPHVSYILLITQLQQRIALIQPPMIE